MNTLGTPIRKRRSILQSIRGILSLRNGDRWIDLAMIVIGIFGIIMIGTACVGTPVEETVNEVGEAVSALPSTIKFALWTMTKQIGFFVSGMGLMFIFRNKINFFNHKVIPLIFWYLVVVALMLYCLTFEPINGSRAWIHLGSFTLQPSEFAKVLLIIGIAFITSEVPNALRISKHYSLEVRKQMKMNRDIFAFWLPLLLCGGIIAICFLGQSDLGTSIILSFICVVCFLTATPGYYRPYQKIIAALVVLAFVILFVGYDKIIYLLSEYQTNRFLAWGDPLNENYVYDASYQLVNGLIAYTNGGLLGVGFGKSTQKFGYIPEAHNDFISAIIVEELGIIGIFFLIVPTTIIIWRLCSYALKVEDNRSKVILFGVATFFFMHMFLNLGGVSGLIPMTGVPLLCISYGGSSTWASFMAIGLAQNVIKRYNRSQKA